MKFIVKRSQWYRGQGAEESKLLNKDGMRCCIGFVAQQCGVPDEKILDKPSIMSVTHFPGIPTNLNHSCDTELEAKFPKWMQSLQVGGNDDLAKAYSANDSLTSDDRYREKLLKEIFSRNGDEIEFED